MSPTSPACSCSTWLWISPRYAASSSAACMQGLHQAVFQVHVNLKHLLARAHASAA